MSGSLGTAAVMGAGAWGTALAKVLADAGNDVRLWARRAEVEHEVNTARVEHRFDSTLNGHTLDSDRVHGVAVDKRLVEGRHDPRRARTVNALEVVCEPKRLRTAGCKARLR